MHRRLRLVGNPLLNKRVKFRLGNHIVVVFKAVLPVDMEEAVREIHCLIGDQFAIFPVPNF